MRTTQGRITARMVMINDLIYMNGRESGKKVRLEHKKERIQLPLTQMKLYSLI